ncbi:glycosyl transferase [Endozoicomonas montiporae]|uniref:Glycosyl transferase n=2 Tax=Endozoicomonas montiporae TaxID=1027273 RepID=A0A081NBY0_9GAMM|nr:glycosyltransferase family 9 protein [Endozoicomonas montiporae]AMO56271.1 glycosyl transferase [Endozoicomonas montiporae CL-33]KEQ15953.1 glycosyl transferase [Endozoicomonas montiporae]
MKVDTMRVIDHYVGVPLCFLLKQLFKVWEFIFRPKPKQPENVLFIELSEMGSAILADPAMRWLKDQGKNLHFVIFQKNAASLKLLKTIPEERIFTIRPDSLFTLAFDSLRFLVWCRQRKIDTTIDLELFSRFTALLSRMSGAVNRTGYDGVHEEGLYRGNFLTHPVMYNPHHHISLNFMALVQACTGDKGQPYQRKLLNQDDIKLARADVDEELKQSVLKKLAELKTDFSTEQYRVMLVNPNASDLLPQRRWMRDRYASVIRQVLDDYQDILVVITGAPAEKAGAEELNQMVDHQRCVNSAGVFTFAELVPLYSVSYVMLSNDSGPPHFASVTELKTFVIFGPETPRLYGALGNSTPIYAGLACSPCVSAGNHRKTTCFDNQCLKAISVDDVLATMKPVLDGQVITRQRA